MDGERETKFPVNVRHDPPESFKGRAWIDGRAQYEEMYQRSVEDPEGFWAEQAESLLAWKTPFSTVCQGSFEEGNVAWFVGGQLNVSYNCVDRHAAKHPDKVAIVYEGDEPTTSRSITYKELLHDVCRCANALKRLGVRPGDAVCIYLPMIPEIAVAMLACTRIGAVHSVVFSAFSADSLASRAQDCNASVLITADQGKRGGRTVHLKRIADEAVDHKDSPVRNVLVVERTGAKVDFQEGRDIWFHDALARERPYCPPHSSDSEDPLFILYTSGSTGKPKGILHTTAGYLLYSAITTRYTFDIKAADVLGCVADCGWITGHTYCVYGPLCLGTTTVLFESTPVYPDPSRYWQMVERHGITVLYTAPTAVRLLMKSGNDPVTKHDRSTLRIIGSVGEPINYPAWNWLYEVVGERRCAVVDTFFQTESAAHLLTPLPGATSCKPGSACGPFFGIRPALLDPTSGQTITENDREGVLVIEKPWPGMTRTVYGDHSRYMKTYFEPYAGYYFTGDGAYRDKDGYYWVTGRVDDVVNVCGHRIGTAELETALIHHDGCNEAAVVAIPHDLKGQAVWAFCVPSEGYQATRELAAELRMKVRSEIGPFAQPDAVVLVESLPKTRSGKIMRRILRKIASDERSTIGDTSTMADQEALKHVEDGMERLTLWRNTK
mmetsp:Transcript_12191/g.34386  ORF Transcript_12191/g.34386 Transcript_12191/m.34386 type:complete len:665 (+) Transcript_12191:66-2060(+)|eukprot:CAMPEP_0119133556 /NCGR_PEP_ID=MMETSP1310-20130426/13432_1 /TAXON_ID=464262 /ORGANISM="Genus nov. species nov., Strain RCC2339" /LENGTH=664 /DNA_ID=CAMNT_0007124249 /DNA_START=66 /DNA_END=2060 /DNA_ORIENTATION=+